MLKKIDVDKLLEIIEAETRAELRFFVGNKDISGCDLVLERAYIADDAIVLRIEKATLEVAIRFSHIASIEWNDRFKVAMINFDEDYHIFFLFEVA
ncbi:MAG: hypothetical protein MRZ63_11345 [Anaerostipes sp.]|nr:hypothetical protein [Anaerostipes sp.]